MNKFEKAWIPCSERLPECNEEVLIKFSNGKIDIGYRVSIFWFPNNEFYADYRVVSWMPLPEKYEGEHK